MEAEQNIEPVKANISKEINIELGGSMGWNVPRKTGKSHTENMNRNSHKKRKIL